MDLPPLSQAFVLHFGEMGSRWGINRTVGQIYALLFISARPLTADEITEKLGVSRSNVSMGIKELSSWRLVRLSHQPGDRRDFYSAPEDVWAIFKTLAEERQRREVDPTLSMLRDALLETPDSPEERHAQARMREMHDLIEQLTDWFAEVRKLSPATLEKLMSLGAKATTLLQFTDRGEAPKPAKGGEGGVMGTGEAMDALMLARIQFAANISFHILFPTITIALAWVLLFFKLRYLKTGDEKWLSAYFFWVKVFALSFGMGVVSGVTMSFQFGTNWPGFMNTVGNIAGPLLAYEVLTAFFLEASFLGIMLFGRKRVGERLHTLATVLVAAGTTMSAFWILALNSWMQTPAGFEMIDGQAHVTSWWAVVFNPSFPYRLVHMLLASGLTVAFLVAGISAFRWLRGEREPDVAAGLRTGVLMAALLIPAQILAGDMHGLNTLEHQPAKIAAMEGIWEDERGAPALLFGWPNEVERRNDYAIGVPGLAALILTHKLDGELKGLASFEDHPPVLPVFWGFRVMVGVGVLMLGVSWLSAWRMRRRRELPPWLLRVLVGMTFSGWVATLAGWYVTEIGRQPWLVTGVLRTADAVSATPAPLVGLSLTSFLIVYGVLLAAYVSVVFHLARKGGKTRAAPITAPRGKPDEE